MTDILGCPIVVDATGETALLTLKAPSFVCMGHQKLKVDFDHCNATIGLDPRHGADAKVFHDGVWVGQADDHVDLVANMVGPSDEAALRRSLAIKVCLCSAVAVGLIPRWWLTCSDLSAHRRSRFTTRRCSTG